MKAYKYIKETRREFIREKRRRIKEAKKIMRELQLGCALWEIFDGTPAFGHAVRQMKAALETMDEITKPLA